MPEAEELFAKKARDPREYLIPEWRKAPDFRPQRMNAPSWDACSPRRRGMLRAAWSKGDLSYKLNRDQLEVYRAFRKWQNTPGRGLYFVFDVARRYGKTYLATLIVVEDVIRNQPGARLAYWADTREMARKIVQPIFRKLIADCPPDMRPRWVVTKSAHVWPDGRELEVCGLDDPDSARGRELQAGVLDEAAFMPKLEYILDSIVDDMTQGIDDAYVLITSTPPTSPAHPFSSRCVPLARAEGGYAHRTVYDNPMLATEDIEKRIARKGGVHSSAVRREMFAEHMVDPHFAIVPEYNDVRHQVMIRPPEKRPEWAYLFVALDPGWVDGTGLLFGYWDYWQQVLVIEREFFGHQIRAGTLAEVVKKTEHELWEHAKRYDRARNEPVFCSPYRWTDVDKRLVSDLHIDHGLTFRQTAKSDLSQQIVQLRDWFSAGRIRITSNCPQLDAQLQAAVYQNEKRRHLARSADKGHFDLVMALVYLVRNVEPFTQKNPGPEWFQAATLRQQQNANTQPSYLAIQEQRQHDRRRQLISPKTRPSAIGHNSKFRPQRLFGGKRRY